MWLNYEYCRLSYKKNTRSSAAAAEAKEKKCGKVESLSCPCGMPTHMRGWN
jgi:hypothetical protein